MDKLPCSKFNINPADKDGVKVSLTDWGITAGLLFLSYYWLLGPHFS